MTAPETIGFVSASLAVLSALAAVGVSWLRNQIRADIAELRLAILSGLDGRYVALGVFNARMDRIDERCAQHSHLVQIAPVHEAT